MFCAYCGNEMVDDALYCPRCGKPVPRDPEVEPAGSDAASGFDIDARAAIASLGPDATVPVNEAGLPLGYGSGHAGPSPDSWSGAPVTDYGVDQTAAYPGMPVTDYGVDQTAAYPGAPVTDYGMVPPTERKSKAPKVAAIIACFVAAVAVAAFVLFQTGVLQWPDSEGSTTIGHSSPGGGSSNSDDGGLFGGTQPKDDDDDDSGGGSLGWPFGGGDEQSGREEFLGSWSIVEMDGGEYGSATREEIELMRSMGLDVVMVFEDDGDWRIDMFGEEALDGSWRYENGHAVVSSSGTDIAQLEIRNGEIELGVAGMSMTFSRSGSLTSGGSGTFSGDWA